MSSAGPVWGRRDDGTAPYDDACMSAGKAGLRPPSARQELEVLRRYPALLPMLIRCGLSAQDALAIAWNTCLVWVALEERRPATPEGVLERFSLGEIAALCEELGEVAQ